MLTPAGHFVGRYFSDPFFFSYHFYLSLRRALAARGPLLSAPAESRQRQAQGSFTPLRIPGPKWGAGRPPLETPLPLVLKYLWRASAPWGCAIRIGRTPRRLRGWSFGAVGEGRERLRARHGRRTSTASFGGFAPLPPRFPNGDVCRSCAHAHGTAPDKAFAATPSQISRKLLPRKRLGVPSLPSRGCAEGTLARPQRGNPKGAQPLWPVFAYFLLARK